MQVAVEAAEEEENIRLLVVEGLRSEENRLLKLGDADEGVAEKFNLELAVRVGDGDAEIDGGGGVLFPCAKLFQKVLRIIEIARIFRKLDKFGEDGRHGFRLHVRFHQFLHAELRDDRLLLRFFRNGRSWIGGLFLLVVVFLAGDGMIDDLLGAPRVQRILFEEETLALLLAGDFALDGHGHQFTGVHLEKIRGLF